MAFDFKKEYKEFYMPKNTPEIVTVQKDFKKNLETRLNLFYSIIQMK